MAKLIEQRAWVCGTGGTYGAVMVTVLAALMVADALCPLSSVTVQVMLTGPVGAPTEEKIAVFPLPWIEPAEAV